MLRSSDQTLLMCDCINTVSQLLWDTLFSDDSLMLYQMPKGRSRLHRFPPHKSGTGLPADTPAVSVESDFVVPQVRRQWSGKCLYIPTLLTCV